MADKGNTNKWRWVFIMPMYVAPVHFAAGWMISLNLGFPFDPIAQMGGLWLMYVFAPFSFVYFLSTRDRKSSKSENPRYSFSEEDKTDKYRPSKKDHGPRNPRYLFSEEDKSDKYKPPKKDHGSMNPGYSFSEEDKNDKYRPSKKDHGSMNPGYSFSEEDKSDKYKPPKQEWKNFSPWSEQFRLLEEYDSLVAQCYKEITVLNEELAEVFRNEVVADRKSAREIADRLISEHRRLTNPFKSEELNAAFNEARKLGKEAEEEFKKVVDLLGEEDTDIKFTSAKIHEKYSSKKKTPGYVLVSEYAEQNSTSVVLAINRIKNGKLEGRAIDGSWYVKIND